MDISIPVTKTPFLFNTTKLQQAEKSSNPEPDIAKNKPTKASAQNYIAYNNISYSKDNKIGINFYNINKPKEVLFSSYSQKMNEIITDVKSRANNTEQSLNWINKLPETQLKNIDEIYNKAEKAKENGYEKLVVIGIGGSRNPVENMVNLLGLNDKVSFYSGVDEISFNNFTKNIDINKTKFLVISKSGSTLETMSNYNKFKTFVENKVGTDKAKQQFIAMTDANPEKSNLRNIADKEGYISGVVHDGVEGRFSIFDDATIFTLVYSGVKKEDATSMLKASLKAQKQFLNADINKNLAAQQAIFNAAAIKESSKDKHFIEYFGDMFKGTKTWETQLKNESLKNLVTTVSDVGPAFLHVKTESDLALENKDSFYTFVTLKNDGKEYNALSKGALKAYAQQNPLSHIELKDLSPESIAEFIELKHFETIYTGMLLRNENDKSKKLPEVSIFNVPKYKKIVKEELKS